MFNVDSTQKIIFCEGEAEGPDFAVFTALLGPKLNIHPAGQKDAITKYAQVHFGTGKPYEEAKKQKRFLIIRDRDFDIKSPDGKLQNFSDVLYLTGVTTIECYFLDPILLRQYRHDISESLLQQTLEKALSQLRNYQAIRWALQDIREYMMENARKEGLIRTSTLDLPNTLPDKPKHNFDKTVSELLDEAKKQIIQLANVIRYLDEPVLGELEAKYHQYQNQFRFFSTQSDMFKYWFDGKELIERWWSEMDNISIKINRDEYYRTCASKIDFTRYPDLIEFRDICWGQK